MLIDQLKILYEEVIIIIFSLEPSFWLSILIVSPTFSKIERHLQVFITKLLYLSYLIIPSKVNVLLSLIGFSKKSSFFNLQEMHKPYESKKTIGEKMRISETFLNETRGGMYLLNEMSELYLGKVVDSEVINLSDDFYFDYDVFDQIEFSFSQLKDINQSKNSEGILNAYSSNKVRKKVKRTSPESKFSEKVITRFKLKFNEVESHFLENIEMLLYLKKLNFRWNVFKALVFIPLVLFISKLIEELLSVFGVYQSFNEIFSEFSIF